MARYPNLLVWNHARELVRRVSRACVRTRGEGDLISQLRRAAISVAANVAEGAERGSDREFIRFLRIADGSNAEVQALTDIAEDALVFDPATAAGIRDQAADVGRLIGGLIRRCAGGG